MFKVFNENLAAQDSVLQHLRTEIHEKNLPSGALLDSAIIAEQLEVREEVVREGIAGLVEEGLVEKNTDGEPRVVVITKRLAQELMDLLGLLLVSAVDRLPEEYQQNTEVVATAKDFSVAVLKGQANSEDTFRSFVQAVFAGSANGELERVGLPVVERAMNIIRLYDSEALLSMWADAFEEFPNVLQESPKEAARHLRVFFVYLVNEIEFMDPIPAATKD